MNNKPEKYVPDFPERYKLVRRASGIGDEDRLEKDLARKLFPTYGAPGSAEAQWSACKREVQPRPFPSDRLGVLLELIDRRGVLKGLGFAVWSRSLTDFRAALISAGLIEPVEALRTVRSDQLAAIECLEDVVNILRPYPHTFKTSNLFQMSFLVLSEDDRRKAASFFCQLMEHHGSLRGSDRRCALVAGAIVARIWTSLAHSKELKRLNEWWETKVGDVPIDLAPLADAAGFVCARNGLNGAYRKNMMRMIQDQPWRVFDYRRQLRYHGGSHTLGEHIAYHIIHRKEQPQILSNDIGRVISVYPELIRDKETDLALFIKQETMKSLVYADVPRSLQRSIEDVIEHHRK